mgnify:CR=1 FL=1
MRADSGEVLWTSQRRVLPATLAADGKRVVVYPKSIAKGEIMLPPWMKK